MDPAEFEQKLQDTRRLLFFALKTLKEIEALHKQTYDDQLSLPLLQNQDKRRKRD